MLGVPAMVESEQSAPDVSVSLGAANPALEVAPWALLTLQQGQQCAACPGLLPGTASRRQNYH